MYISSQNNAIIIYKYVKYTKKVYIYKNFLPSRKLIKNQSIPLAIKLNKINILAVTHSIEIACVLSKVKISLKLYQTYREILRHGQFVNNGSNIVIFKHLFDLCFCSGCNVTQYPTDCFPLFSVNNTFFVYFNL